jgi:hypothetical protein
MTEPKTVAEQLDAAQSGKEFGQVLQGLFANLEKQMDEEKSHREIYEGMYE